MVSLSLCGSAVFPPLLLLLSSRALPSISNTPLLYHHPDLSIYTSYFSLSLSSSPSFPFASFLSFSRVETPKTSKPEVRLNYSCLESIWMVINLLARIPRLPQRNEDHLLPRPSSPPLSVTIKYLYT